MTEPTESFTPRSEFVTFYSFKGGVGRSMALINVAGIMAGRGYKVLALDMDLEAPGISYLMRHEAGKENELLPGFIDLLSEACEEGESADLFALSPQEVVEKYSYEYTVPKEIRQNPDGFLRIMPAGGFDGNYQERLDGLGLGQLYKDGVGKPLIEAFKKIIVSSKCFDFVFVDSRTGFSDESGICTRDLADYLVVIMGLNRQNEEGTAEFLRSLRLYNISPKKVRVVLSPVPNGEDDLVEQRENEAAESLTKAFGSQVDLSLHIPYHPRLALTEEPHIFRRSRGYLYDAYASIEQAVLNMLGMTVRNLSKVVEKAAEEKDAGQVIYRLKQLEKLDKGEAAMESLVMGPLKELCLGTDASELRKYLAGTLPAGSLATSFLATELHQKKLSYAEQFYINALKGEPIYADLLGDYAVFLTDVLRDHERAEIYFERALRTEPSSATVLGNYAVFLRTVRKDHDRAEAYFKRSLAARPNDANSLGSYAKFLSEIRKDHERAEVLYKRSFVSNPSHAYNLANYAVFLANVRKDFEKAESVFKQAIEAEPSGAGVLESYASFLATVGKNLDGAETCYKRALESEPDRASTLGNYALFLQNVRKDYVGAEAHYKRALESEPDQANNLGNYALFLQNVRKDYVGAEAHYKRALESEPDQANNLGNYALFLQNVRKDYVGAEAYYKRALKAEPGHVNTLGNYAVFLENVRKDQGGAEALYKRALESEPDNANALGNYAQLLFLRSRNGDAEALLKKAWEQNPSYPPLLCELHFYACAHCWEAYPESLASLKKLLEAGEKTEYWPLEENVKVALKAGHPHGGFIAALAKVVSGEETVETLEKFEVWQKGRF